MINYKSPFFKAFISTIFGSGFSKLILIAVTFYCTHVLSKEHFGAFSFVRNTLNMILCMCVANYINLCTKFTVESQTQRVSRVRLLILYIFSLTICLIVGLGLGFAPSKWLINITGKNDLLFSFRLIGFLLPLFMLQPLNEGILRGLKKFKIIGVVQVSTSILFFLCVAIGIQLNNYIGGIYGMLLYYSSYSVITICIVSRYINIYRIIKRHFKEIRSEVSVVNRMILPVFILSFIEAPLNWWAQVIMAKNAGMVAISTMTAILQIRNLVIILPSYYMNTFTSFATLLNAQHNYKEYYNKFGKSIIVFILGSFLLLVVFQFFSKQILGLYGTEYTEDSFPFFVANLSIPFLLVGNLLKIDLIIHEHLRLMLIVSIISSIAFIGCMLLLIHVGIDSVVSYFGGQLAQVLIIYLMFKIQYNKNKYELYEKI